MVSLRSVATLISYVALILVMVNGEAESHELRPSDHGLEYQNLAPAGNKSPPEMMTFFGRSSPTSTSSNFAMPRAMDSNSTDDRPWWGTAGFDGGHKSRVRDVLLVASVACGVTGVALMVVSAGLYIFMLRRRRSQAPPPLPSSPPQSSTAALTYNDDDNKLQIVVRD